MEHTFTAEPTWIGDRVVMAAYEDAVKSGPGRPDDPTQGRGSSQGG